jgi:peptide chain release factor subunit 1
MFNESDLQELLEFNAPDSVLSVYLNTDPSSGNADAYKLRLRNMLKEVDLPEDVARIEHFFNTEFDWSGRGIAIFSCAAEDFFRAYPLAIAVHDLVQVGDSPSVKPLANLLDT